MQMDMNSVNLRSTDYDQSVDLISHGFGRKVNVEFNNDDANNDNDDDLKLLPDLERRSSVDSKLHEIEGRSSVENKLHEIEGRSSVDSKLHEIEGRSSVDSKLHEIEGRSSVDSKLNDIEGRSGRSSVDVDDKHDEGEEDEDDDSDFTFMFIGDHDSSNFNDNHLDDGEIRPAFPLFDQNLLLDGEYDLEEIDRLPIAPPVDKIFIESPRGVPSGTTSEYVDPDDAAAAGPYCDWSKESASATATANAELSKKSNSTGFSKLWRLREKVGRSNSDGRDAFVFLKHSDRMTSGSSSTSSSAPPSTAAAAAHIPMSNRTFVKVNVTGGKARVVNVNQTKAKKATVSAHEAYLKSRNGGHTEEERRRSYLPYRPELMGFFTNVHGGLSKNVHPY